MRGDRSAAGRAGDPDDGLQLWGATISAYSVSRCSIKVWSDDFSPSTAIPIGSRRNNITGLCSHNSMVYVFKDDSVWTMQKYSKITTSSTVTTDIAVEQPYGITSTQDPHNGHASASHNNFLYFNWLTSTERLFGGSLDDIGQDWGGIGLPDDRQGYVTKYEPAVGWLFTAIDAGSGTSSVLCYDGIAWHETLRGYKAGKRIANIKWQSCPGTRNILWTSIGGDLVYQEFPINSANPLNDSACKFQHEGVITSSTIDMGAASRLPKYIKGLVINSKNLSDNGMVIDFDYQTDEQISTSNWVNVYPGFFESPEQEIVINEANIRQFRYRLRLNTDTATKPPIIKGIVPSGYARTPWRTVWHLRIKTGEIFDNTGRKLPNAEKLKDWLRDQARFPGVIHMTSRFEGLHNKYVVIAPLNDMPTSEEKSTMTVSLMEF